MNGSTRTIAKNTFYNAIGGIGVQLLTIITGIFVARHFGAESFGQLTYTSTIVGYFTLVTEFGLSTIAIRIVAVSGEPHRYIFSYLVLRLALALFALMVLTAIIVWTDPPDATRWLFIAYGVTVPIQVLRMNWVFYAQQKMLIDNLLQIGEKLLYVAGLFSLAYLFSNIVVVPIALVISTLLTAIFGWAVLVRESKNAIAWKLDIAFMREMVVKGWPIGVAGAALRSNSNADTIFVNAYHGDAQTGFYGAAYRLINAMITAGAFFTGAVFPISCRRYKESASSLAGFIGYAGQLLVILTVPGVMLLSLNAEGIIRLIFGSEYDGAVTPFRMLVWAAGTAIVCRLFHNTLVACERQHGYMKVILISAVFNLGANFALIPGYGLVGAATATILTELLLLVMTYAVLSRALRMSGLRDLFGILLCSLVSAAVFLLPIHMLGASFIYIAVYLTLLFGMGVLGAREWQLLATITGRKS